MLDHPPCQAAPRREVEVPDGQACAPPRDLVVSAHLGHTLSEVKPKCWSESQRTSTPPSRSTYSWKVTSPDTSGSCHSVMPSLCREDL